jgi:hypothetical protein
MKLLIEPRAADGRRLQPPTGGHGVIGNKGAFAARSRRLQKMVSASSSIASGHAA